MPGHSQQLKRRLDNKKSAMVRESRLKIGATAAGEMCQEMSESMQQPASTTHLKQFDGRPCAIIK